MEWFGVFVDIAIEPPFKVAWTFLEFNGVVVVSVEETLQLAENRCSMGLVGVRFAVEYYLCSVDGVCYNDDLWDVIFEAGLVDTASDGEQFRLHTCYKHCMVYCFGEWLVRYVNVWNRCSNVVLDASICDYKSSLVQGRDFKNYIIKFLSVNFVFFFFFSVN